MSGGSWGYLYGVRLAVDDIVDAVLSRRDDFRQMADRLETYRPDVPYGARRAAKQTLSVIKMAEDIRAAEQENRKRLEDLYRRLEDVWRAVEWEDSFDTCREDTVKKLIRYGEESPMTNAELTELEALAGKATAGPWGHHPSEAFPANAYVVAPQDDEYTFYVPIAESGPADAAFIAAARQAVPNLIAEVRRLRRALRDDRESCARVCEGLAAEALAESERWACRQAAAMIRTGVLG